MGMTISTEGIGELGEMLAKLGAKADEVAGYSLYEGAGVVADAYRSAINSIATEPFKYAPPGKTRLPSPEEKAALLNARHGIAKFRYDGTEIRTSIGFQQAGYADVNGRRKPLGQIANSIASGTSFMEKQPFLREAFVKGKKAAEAAIEAGIRKREDELTLD